jgi:hypothetical protein
MNYSIEDKQLWVKAALAVLQAECAGGRASYVDVKQAWSTAKRFVDAQPIEVASTGSIVRQK